MSSAELLQILLPLVVTAILLALVVGYARWRSAARERALQELADRSGLEYTGGGHDLFQGSWPGTVGGSYRGRKLTLHYRDDPYTAPAGYHRASYSAVIEMAVRNPQQGSLSLQARYRDRSSGGDRFERRVTVGSKPQAFAAALLGDPALRERLAAALTRDWFNPARINVVRTGSLVFVRPGIIYSGNELVTLLELLGDLAERVESLPGTPPAQPPLR